MTPHLLLASALALLVAVDFAAGADPLVAHLTAAQRSGAKLVVATSDATVATCERKAVHGTSSHPHSRSRTHRQTA